ncbi:MAG: hypothetical protein RJA98_1752, partial [Pseudomonadota bacterium]
MRDALPPAAPAYAELHCRSNFSFLTGASHPEELVQRAVQLGYSALALTDECSLSGVVRAHTEAERQQLHLVIGAEMRLSEPGVAAFSSTSASTNASTQAATHAADAPAPPTPTGPRLILLAQTRRGYGNLSQWITVARRRAAKGHYLAWPSDLEGAVPTAPYLAGLPDCLALLVPQPGQPLATLLEHAQWLQHWLGDR